MRIRYAKRGRLRFTSHRDVARAFERALRRAQVPMAFSAGFSPHPKISWVGAAPTGVASEAEYVELGLARAVEPAWLQAALDESLPAGLDVLEVVPAPPGPSLAERVTASSWRIALPGVPAEAAAAAVRRYLAAGETPVQRLARTGMRTLDPRAATVELAVVPGECAILHLVLRHVTPAVRPDDVLTALRSIADLALPLPAQATRIAQGPLTGDGGVGDPLAPDRPAGATGATRQDAEPDPAVAGGP